MNAFSGLAGDLLTALSFLTRLPLGWLRRALGREEMGAPGEAMAVFPLVGLVLGMLLAVLDGLLSLTRLPLLSRDVLLVVALVWYTGGLHLDGLMDACDGLLGGHTVEQRLLIMRDSRVGSFGVLGGVCVLLLKVGLLDGLPGGSARQAALVLAPLLGRWALVLAAALFPPARPTGLGAAFRAGVTPARFTTALLTSAVVCLAVGGASGALALAGSCAVTWLLGRAMMAAIPGLTGDSYGAIAELNEVAVLLLLALAG
jgi:adenosylcobinamide-GDP ribazoletransferase